METRQEKPTRKDRKGKGGVTKRGRPRKTVERDEWDEAFPSTESDTDNSIQFVNPGERNDAVEQQRETEKQVSHQV